ncbi:MAG: TonB-dependent receptor [Sphingomonadaceae bacterium]
MTNVRLGLMLVASWSALSISQGVSAQISQGSAANEPAAEEENQYADIVVTANKRIERLNDVGATITALPAEVLQARRISSLEDIAATVPGLSFSNTSTNQPVYTLRGIGFNESSLAVYPAVSVYIDQAPLSFPALTLHSAYDLERIEVLKGPQGTLFGQNSTGGAINYIAAKPTDTFKAGADVSYGRFNSIEGNAYMSGPLTETLKGRIAVTGLHSDDWQYSVTRDDTNGHQSYVAGRLLLDWDPTDVLKVSLNVNGWRDRSQPQALQNIGVRPRQWADPAVRALHAFYANPVWGNRNARSGDWSTITALPRLGVGTPGYDPNDPTTWGTANLDLEADNRLWQSVLRADWKIGGGVTLTSLTSYADYKQDQRMDTDGLVQAITNHLHNDGTIKAFNQEVRLANEATNSLRWVLGATYEQSKVFQNQVSDYPDNTAYVAGFGYINNSSIYNHQKMVNYAGFGNVEYDVSEGLTVKAGIRYTQLKNNTETCSYSLSGGNTAELLNFYGMLLGTVPFNPIMSVPDGTNPGNNCYTLDVNNVPGAPFKGSLKQHNVSWRIGLDYKLNSDTLLYINASRGFKAGNFPVLAGTSYVALDAATQERLTAYEGGIKATLLDRKLQVNAAAFYYDYRDKQERGRQIDPIFGALETLINVPKSRVIGVEADITARPVNGVTITGSVTHLDTKIQKTPAAPRNINVIGQVDDFTGAPLPYASKWSATLDFDYRFKVNSDGMIFGGATLMARSAFDTNLGGGRLNYLDPDGCCTPGTPIALAPGITNPFSLKGYATVDGRFGYEGRDGAWRVMLWGKNILNKYYLNAVFQGSDSTAGFAGRPATYGVTLGFKLN